MTEIALMQFGTVRLCTAIACLALALSVGIMAHAQEVERSPSSKATYANLYDDSRVIAWSRNYLAGKEEEVLKSVELDLVSDDPHPFAAHVWTQIHRRRDRLAAVWSGALDPRLRAALGVLPEIQLLVDQSLHRQVLDRYPPSAADRITDGRSLILLAASAAELGQPDDQVAYLVAASERYPTQFSVVPMFEDALKSDALRALVAEMIQADGPLHGTPVAEYLELFLATRPWHEVDRLAAIDHWLAAHSLDAGAWNVRGRALYALGYFQESAEAHLRAIEAYPFLISFRDGPKALLRLGKEKDARALLERVRMGFGDAVESVEKWADYRLAGALRVTGNKGRARQVLSAALERWPHDAELLAEQAELELADNRYDEAVTYARRSLEQDRTDLQHQLRLMEALLRAGELQLALELFEQTRHETEFRSRAFYYRGSQILGAMERNGARVDLMTRAVAEYPQSTWMLGELAAALQQAGDTRAAATMLLRALELNPEYSWSSRRMSEYLGAAKGESGALETIGDLIRRYPWQREYWEQRQDLTGESDTELWRNASRYNPNRSWAVGALVFSLHEEERWADAKQAVDELFDTSPYSAFDRAERHVIRAELVALQASSERVDSDLLERSLVDLDAFRARYGHLRWYHHFREKILRSLNREAEGAQEQLALSRMYPDHTLYWLNLIRQYEKELGAAQTMGRWATIVERNPYDGDRLKFVARIHVQWGGSPIIALDVIQQIKERGLLSSREYGYWEGVALGQLGDSVAEFEARYRNATSVGDSDRYVSWYEDVRRAALDGSRRAVRLVDDESGFPTVEITLPNGEILRRADHPVSGSPALLAKGPHAVRATYDPTGSYMLGVRASHGAKIAMEYDERGNLAVIRNNRHGTLLVSYDEQDDVADVETLSPLGATAKSGASGAFSILREFRELLVNFRRGNFDVSIPRDDDRVDELRDAYEDAGWSDNSLIRAHFGLKLARHLVEHLDADGSYAGEARLILDDVIDGRSETASAILALLQAEAITLWHRWAHMLKPRGLPADDFHRWLDIREWLRRQAAVRADARFADWFAQVEAAPLSLLPDALWLPRSDLVNSGFWTRYDNSDFLPPEVRPEPRATTVLARTNGDLVIGSQVGLSVLRHGFWERFGFDDRTGRFARLVDAATVSSSSDILTLAETDDGVLWIGTARGLYALQGDYDEILERWRTVEDGLPSPRVEHLLARGMSVLVGTARGLRIGSLGSVAGSIPEFADEEIVLLAPAASHGGSSSALIGTAEALYLTSAGQEPVRVTPWAVDGAVWLSSHSQVVVRRGTEMYGIAQDNGGRFGVPSPLPGQQNLRYTKQVHGLALVDVTSAGEAVAVFTDEGLSFYRDSHFEYMPLPLEEQRLGLQVGPYAAASDGEDMHLLTHEALYSFNRGNVAWDKSKRVYDIVTDTEGDLVYVARGDGIDVRSAGEALSTSTYDRLQYAAQHLAIDEKDRLVANDSHTIVRFDKSKGASVEEVLFAAVPTQDADKGYGSGPVRDILISSDGVIWVASGGSVFRWKDGDVEEFSFFANREQFPSRTHMISRVAETPGGEIWAIASNEGHLSYEGVILEGGVLEWTGDGFRRISLPDGYRMITGYTRIDENTAIAGSTAGFYRHAKDGSYQSFSATGDATYSRLKESTPLLWLGGDGARIEAQSWLFPSAGGVLLYHQGRWFYPERLNQLLPDDPRLGQYGGRTVHAVAVDAHGRIYAGTDRGLLIYEADGVVSLLINNGFADDAFADMSMDHLQKQRSILLDDVDGDSEPSRIVARIHRLEQEIRELHDALTATSIRESADDSERLSSEQTDTVSVQEGLQRREREQQRLLNRLENEHFGLFQLLKLDPRELGAMHEELGHGQAVVQYLPTPSKLYINLATKDDRYIREVVVDAEELYERVSRVASQLAVDAYRLAGIDQTKARGLTSLAAAQSEADIHADLIWLYDRLLRPVEREIMGKDHVFVVPVGALTYLPFSALIRRVSNEIWEYAVDRIAIGVLPSLFHLQLVLRHRGSYLGMEESLVLGDPDGTLLGARDEAQEVAEQLSVASSPVIGEDATIENFLEMAPRSRIIHLATHGRLNHEHPQDSYLVLADDDRLSVADIAVLDLEETDLVVLSACETGIGRDGLEYATLARAFAHARVPTVVASLWQVNDPATRELMSQFYRSLVDTGDVFEAMANAQREMIRRNDYWSAPAAWSGFVVFGKPRHG